MAMLKQKKCTHLTKKVVVTGGGSKHVNVASNFLSIMINKAVNAHALDCACVFSDINTYTSAELSEVPTRNYDGLKRLLARSSVLGRRYAQSRHVMLMRV